MAYTKLYEKLAKAWGCDCESNTEYGALKAIAENPPFGTKTEMVEIVPKKKVENFLTSDNKSFTTIIASNVSLEIGKTYRVLFNDKEYIAECYDDNGYKTIGTPYGAEYTYYPFNICANGNTLEMIKGTIDDCTFALYEVQETVKQLDPKFVGGGAGRGFDMIIVCDWFTDEARLVHGDYTAVKQQLDEYGFAIIGISEVDTGEFKRFDFCGSINNNDDTIVVYNSNMSAQFTIYSDNSVYYNDIG